MAFERPEIFRGKGRRGCCRAETPSCCRRGKGNTSTCVVLARGARRILCGNSKRRSARCACLVVLHLGTPTTTAIVDALPFLRIRPSFPFAYRRRRRYQHCSTVHQRCHARLWRNLCAGSDCVDTRLVAWGAGSAHRWTMGSRKWCGRGCRSWVDGGCQERGC